MDAFTNHKIKMIVPKIIRRVEKERSILSFKILVKGRGVFSLFLEFLLCSCVFDRIKLLKNLYHNEYLLFLKVYLY